MTTLLRLDVLTADDQIQPRADVDSSVVDEYAEAMARGTVMPPVEACYDGDRYWLYDGFQRVRAARKAGLDALPALIRGGSRDDAAWLAAASNQGHGQRRTTADKRRAVQMALRLRGEYSDRAIADHVGVSHMMVADVRREFTAQLEDSSTYAAKPAKRVGKDGKSYPAKPVAVRRKPPPGADKSEPEIETLMSEAEARLSPEGREALARMEREAADRERRRTESREREQTRADRLSQAREHLRQAVRHLRKAGGCDAAVTAAQEALTLCSA